MFPATSQPLVRKRQQALPITTSDAWLEKAARSSLIRCQCRTPQSIFAMKTNKFEKELVEQCKKNGFILTYVNGQPVLKPAPVKPVTKANNDLEVLKSLRYR
jgi:hypothetical protein